MQGIVRSDKTRRVFDRRQLSGSSPEIERRVADRRMGIERREHQGLQAGGLGWRSPALSNSSTAPAAHPQNSFLSSIPLWGPLGVFVIAFMFLMTKFGMTTLDVSPFTSSPAGDSDQAEGMNAYETGEVIVYDPSEANTSDLIRSGYVIIETMEMKELGLKIQHLRVPAGMTVPEALSDLRSRFPALEVDANHKIRPANPS